MNLSVNEMTRKEFDTLPEREWGEEIVCSCLVILPGRAKDIHGTGYRMMDFVAVNDNQEPICRLSGCSDVIHIEGVCGFGKDWLARYGGVPDAVPPRRWCIDCLSKSGLLRLFVDGAYIVCGGAHSSFEIYSVPREDTGNGRV